MILEEVEIKNFRSHWNTKVRFDQGITVIVGDNGSGKTSILEAVNFALFKETPRRVKIEELVRRGAEKEGMEVSLVFHSNGKKYNAVRGVAGRNSINKLYDGEGGIITEGEKGRQTTREIEETIHMDAKLFTNAMYIKQGQIDALLTAEARERKELVGRLIGTQDLESAWQKMSELIGEYARRIERLLVVPGEIKKWGEKIEDEKREIAQLEGEIKIVDRNLSDIKQRFEGREKEISQLERLKDLLNVKEKSVAEMENLREKIKAIESYEMELRETEEANKTYLELKQKIDVLNNEKIKLAEYSSRNAQLNKEAVLHSSKVGEISKLIKSEFEKCSLILGTGVESPEKLTRLCQESIKSIEEKLGVLREKKEHLTSKTGKLAGNNEQLQKAISELQEAEDKCPVCSAKLTMEHKQKLLEKYSVKIGENNAEISKCEKKMGECVEEESALELRLHEIRGINVAIIESKISEKSEIKNRIDEISREIEENKKWLKKLDGIEKNLSEKKISMEGLEEGYKRYEVAKGFLRKNLPDKGKFQDEINGIEKRIENLEEEINEVRYAPERIAELDELRRLRNILQKKLIELEKEKSRVESATNEKTRYIKNLTEELKHLKIKENELKRLAEFKIFLERIRGLFHKDNLQRELRVRSKPLIERYTREEFDKFNLPYSDISINEDFDITVYGASGEESVDMLSGGERIAAAIALRIGIAKAISGSTMELLMLDEPTIHLDATRRRELVEIIKKLATIPQTIVVTHDKEFESAADKLLQVEKAAGISQVVES